MTKTGGQTGSGAENFVAVKGTKTRAQQMLRELLSAQDKGISITNAKTTVASWLAKWMIEYVVPNTRQKTTERYKGIIDRHIIPAIGHVELMKLTPSDIQAMEASLLAEGMAPKGVELVHTVISGSYKYAARMKAA